MEEIIEDVKKEIGDNTQYQTTMQLIFTYLNNINENSTAEKYRKIKIANKRFSNNIWQYVNCQTLFLMMNFELTDDGFLLLPIGVSVSLFLNHIKETMAKDGINFIQGTSQSSSSGSTLKLNTGDSMFREELKPDLTLLSYLVEMGYSKKNSERALVATQNKGVQPAMDWLLDHPDCDVEMTENQTVAPSISSVNTSKLMGIMENPYQEETTESRLKTSSIEKHKYQEKLRIEAVKKAKLEKQEEKRAKQMLMKNLQAERQAANEKFEMEKRLRHASDDSSTSHSVSVKETSDNPTSKDTSASSSSSSMKSNIKIKVKLPSGQIASWCGGEDATSIDLYNFVATLVDSNAKDYVIIQPHPHILLNKSDQQSLKDKGMYPSATVVVMETKSVTPSNKHELTPEETSE